MAKGLTVEQINEINEFYNSGEFTQEQLASDYGVSVGTIRRAIKSKSKSGSKKKSGNSVKKLASIDSSLSSLDEEKNRLLLEIEEKRKALLLEREEAMQSRYLEVGKKVVAIIGDDDIADYDIIKARNIEPVDDENTKSNDMNNNESAESDDTNDSANDDASNEKTSDNDTSEDVNIDINDGISAEEIVDEDEFKSDDSSLNGDNNGIKFF